MPEIIIPKESSLISSHKEVRKICDPIFKLFGLNFFRYLRVYKDFSRIHLCTNPEWTENFYAKKFHNVAWFDSTSTTFTKNMEFIWDLKALSEDNSVGIEARNNFGFYHGISLVRKSNNYFEVYDFATHAENENINTLYMQNIEIFDRFILFFKEKAKNIIFESTQAKIEIDRNFRNQYLSIETSIDKQNSLKEFRNETKLKRIYLDSYEGDSYLTISETKCIYWSLLGKNSEEIGTILGSSKRTIESHLNNVKSKLGIAKITQIHNIISFETIKEILK